MEFAGTDATNEPQDVWQIHPTSCRCGGNLAWYKRRPSGAWESAGCVCHNTPDELLNTSLRAVPDE